MARPRKEIDLDKLRQFCRMCPTDEEVAAFFDVSVDTITRRKAEPSFAEAMENGKAEGRASLRGKQWTLAMNGDKTMLIWLGKQSYLLGQSDFARHEHSGPDGGAINLRIDADLEARAREAAKRLLERVKAKGDGEEGESE